MRSLASIQKCTHIELWDFPIRWLIRGQTYGLSPSSVTSVAVLRRCFNEFDNLNSALILIPLFDSCPNVLMNTELTRLAHVVLSKINYDNAGLIYAKIMKSFLGAISRSFSDLKKKGDSVSKVIENCWRRNLEFWKEYCVWDFLE